jgi:peptidoglycan-associated lipoprotein
MNKRIVLRCIPVLLAGLLVCPLMAQSAPQELTINVEIELSATGAKIYAFKHNASGDLVPGDRVWFNAEADVPSGGSLQLSLAGATKASMKNVGGRQYEGTLTIPELKNGRYDVVAQIIGQGVPAVKASASSAIMVNVPVVAKKPVVEKPVAIVPPADDNRDIMAICSAATQVVNGLPVRFDFDISTPNLYTASNLDRIAQEINAAFRSSSTVEMTIEGHADNQGDELYNNDLGRRRARNIRISLMKRGIDGDRIRIVSRGETAPLDAGSGAASLAKNRRVEFLLKCK